MLMMMDSPWYCVVDLIMKTGEPSSGIEIVDKRTQRELFLQGEAAEQFRQQVHYLSIQSPDLDDIEAFIEGYRPWMQNSLSVH